MILVLRMIVESLLEDLLFSVKSNKPHFHQDHSLRSHLIPDQLIDLLLQLDNRLIPLCEEYKIIIKVLNLQNL